MLSTEESNMIEELIDSNPEMVEIQDAIDSVDDTFLYVINEEIPMDCLADEFSVPDIGHGEDYHDADCYKKSDSQNDICDTGY